MFAPGLAWEACLKNTGIKLVLLTSGGISGGISHAIYRYAEANNKYMKNYNKNKDSSYLMYLDENDLYGWAMSQKLPVDGFK